MIHKHTETDYQLEIYQNHQRMPVKLKLVIERIFKQFLLMILECKTKEDL